MVSVFSFSSRAGGQPARHDNAGGLAAMARFVASGVSLGRWLAVCLLLAALADAAAPLRIRCFSCECSVSGLRQTRPKTRRKKSSSALLSKIFGRTNPKAAT